MAMTVSTITITVNGNTYTGTVSSSKATIALPASARGAKITGISCTQTGGTAPLTITGGSTEAMPATVNITITDSTASTPLTATVALTTKIFGETSTLTKPGWFSFRRMEETITYASGGVTLAGVKEVLSVQCKSVSGYEFDPYTKKLTLFTSAGTEKGAGSLDVTLLVLLDA